MASSIEKPDLNATIFFQGHNGFLFIESLLKPEPILRFVGFRLYGLKLLHLMPA
jgi:hypothetical protein